VQLVEPFVVDTDVCDKPVTAVLQYLRLMPNLDTHAAVITDICDPVSISARTGDNCPQLSRMRIIAVPNTTLVFELDVPTNGTLSTVLDTVGADVAEGVDVD